MVDRQKTLAILEKVRLVLPLLVIAVIVVSFTYNVLKSPDMVQEIKERFGITAGIDAGGGGGDWHYATLDYVGDKDKMHQGDLYEPVSRGVNNTPADAAPAIVVIHGGSWAKGDRHEMDSCARYLEAKNYAVFNIETRLVGSGGGYPRDIDDACRAVEFLRDNHAKFKIDPNRIYLLGLSSGAHVALMAAYRGDLEVAGVAGISSPTNLATVRDNLVKLYLEAGNLPYDSATLQKVSPMSYVSRAVPTILVHGNDDHSVPYSQSVDLYKKLQAAGKPCALITVNGADHFIMGESKNRSLQAIVDFFAGQTSHGQTQISPGAQSRRAR